MNLREFEELILNEVKEQTEENAEVLVHSVTKNNGLKLSGIIILKPKERMSPTIYLESFYEDYLKGRGIESIVKEIMRIYDEQKGQIDFDPEKFKNIGETKNQIMYKLINYEKNEELLKCVPHRRFLDLAVVYYVVVTSNQFGIGSILVRNEHLEFWNIGEEDLFALASINTPRKMPCEINSMTNMIIELINKKEAENEDITEIASGLISEVMYEADNNGAFKMYVLTNHQRVNGANTILYKNVLKNFASQIDSDLYILPSSIHEIIIVPKEPGVSEKMLKKTVKDVNEQNVIEEEWLSDNVYTYERISDSINII